MSKFDLGVNIYSIDKDQKELTVHLGEIRDLHNKYIRVKNNWEELKGLLEKKHNRQ